MIERFESWLASKPLRTQRCVYAGIVVAVGVVVLGSMMHLFAFGMLLALSGESFVPAFYPWLYLMALIMVLLAVHQEWEDLIPNDGFVPATDRISEE